MKTGISTACLYPNTPENSLDELLSIDYKTFEIFINSLQEVKKDYIKEIKAKLNYYDASIVSMHPFTSLTEGMYFFEGYDRRFTDGIELYKNFFEAANELSIKMFVLHGQLSVPRVKQKHEDEKYCENYVKLNNVAKEFGITVCHENVYRYKCGHIEHVRAMKEILGDEVHFTFDVKQAIRQQVDPFDMLKAMGSSLKHVHLSDNHKSNDCLLPGKGDFDIARLRDYLQDINYTGAVITEVYRGSYETLEDIRLSKNLVDSIFTK